MIAALVMACSGDKTAPTAVAHTGSTEEPPGHTGIEGHSGYTLTCPDVPIAPHDWGPNDDPCEILDGSLFTSSACTKIWFENGWMHYYSYQDYTVNKPYECLSKGPIAYLKACNENDGGFRFDRRTGALTTWGYSTWVLTAREWGDHSGTPLDDYFYRDSGYTPRFCWCPHTGVWGP